MEQHSPSFPGVGLAPSLDGTEAEALWEIADDLARLKGRFIDGNHGRFLDPDDAAEVIALVTHAKLIVDKALGPVSAFSMQFISIITEANTYDYGPSQARVSEAEQVSRRAGQQIDRLARKPAPPPAASGTVKPPYVSATRLAELRALKNPQWDFTKLVQLCNELNLAHEHACHYAVAMLLRAIIDHVPPVFGVTTFSQVVANHSAGRSFKGSMEHLDIALRKIADGHLHQPIRNKEVLPAETQVAFQPQLDQLLGEIFRISK